MSNIDYTLSDYAQKQLASTCCHKLLLEKDNQYYWGIYNGFSFWGRVEYGGNLIETLYSEGEMFEGVYEQSNFAPVDFINDGYNIID